MQVSMQRIINIFHARNNLNESRCDSLVKKSSFIEIKEHKTILLGFTCYNLPSPHDISLMHWLCTNAKFLWKFIRIFNFIFINSSLTVITMSFIQSSTVLKAKDTWLISTGIIGKDRRICALYKMLFRLSLFSKNESWFVTTLWNIIRKRQ